MTPCVGARTTTVWRSATKVADRHTPLLWVLYVCAGNHRSESVTRERIARHPGCLQPFPRASSTSLHSALHFPPPWSKCDARPDMVPLTSIRKPRLYWDFAWGSDKSWRAGPI